MQLTYLKKLLLQKTSTHTILTAIFQVNLGKSVAPSDVLTSKWGCHNNTIQYNIRLLGLDRM